MGASITEEPLYRIQDGTKSDKSIGDGIKKISRLLSKTFLLTKNNKKLNLKVLMKKYGLEGKKVLELEDGLYIIQGIENNDGAVYLRTIRLFEFYPKGIHLECLIELGKDNNGSNSKIVIEPEDVIGAYGEEFLMGFSIGADANNRILKNKLKNINKGSIIVSTGGSCREVLNVESNGLLVKNIATQHNELINNDKLFNSSGLVRSWIEDVIKH